ncbi:exodeoxyribonuclease V subunit gamma [Bowmanella dokdonensis]|uniref:RecBCD enzyme subunit RecC n=1 Tax=Bowmanella dokdonensis TaxID=751969 RepID=A0A939DMR8_9ALTE|nr:exodeoxyribonuclease V subunit gamma [Bowmanella dokdonensis]MBN7824661.1 exodeoxyribonuclease V subunit gamma [Bowmanella dokdonensis]
MLHLIQSNKMEVLAQRLCQVLAMDERSLDNLFDSTPVWVQSPGMAQWLKLQIAQQRGIAANLEFPLPSSFIWQLYRQLKIELPPQSAFTKANMTWKLMALLPELCEQPRFAPVAGYLGGDRDIKLFQLSGKIADIFDQYLVYRPDWLLAWEQGDDRLEGKTLEHQAWQPVLWRELVAYTAALGESPWHRANLHQALMEALQQQQAPPGLPAALLVFGISALPVQQLEVLQALARHIDVLIFWFNPSQHYWGDLVDEKRKARAGLRQRLDGDETADYLDVGNPLLSSWGKLGRDFQDMLLELEPQQQDEFVEDPPASLLQHIQDEILNLTLRGSSEPFSLGALTDEKPTCPKITVQAEDQSLQLVSCHSRLRELEALHDKLLAFFQQHADAHPGEVIVMMPDVAQYAPLIHGVFGAHRQELAIPYAISDRSLSQESPLLNSFIGLMKLQQQRLNLAEVMDLLEVPAVLRRFELSEPEFEQLRHWLADAGVRWGLDGPDKARWQVPEEEQNTWLFGLKRLIAGYAMNQPLYQSRDSLIAPYAHIEGQSSQVLSKLLDFLQQLTLWLEFCLRPATLGERIGWVLAHLDAFYLADEEDEAALHTLRQALTALEAHQLQYPHAVDQAVFSQILEQQLQESGVGQRFLAGAVNFCTLMPMRSVPFRLVCLLGMNDADYPLQVIPMGFDLMQDTRPRRGDRSRRLDDKYLFLEALLSARQGLYISYLGRSARDNSPLMPSILVSELLEYLQQVYCLAEGDDLLAKLCRTHHLQPFHEDYFRATGATGHDSRWLELARLAGQAPLAQPFFNEDLAPLQAQSEVMLEDWLRFFHNTARGFFQLRWQARFTPLQDNLQQDEPFALNALDRFSLLAKLAEQGGHDEIQSVLKAEGKLPHGHAGQLALAALQQDSDELRLRLTRYRQDHAPRRVLVDLTVAGLTLRGWQDHLYQDNLVLWRSGRIRARDKLELWLRLLVLRAQQTPVNQAVYVGTEAEPFELGAMAPQQALALLSDYVQAWQQGHQKPLLLLPECGWHWLDSQDPQKVLNLYTGSDFGAASEGQDVHINRIWPELEPHFEQFAATSERLLGPLFSQVTA